MGLFVRMIGIIVVVFNVLIVGALVVGERMQTTPVVGYLTDGNSRYIDYVEDIVRGIRLPLAGTRCFEAFPYRYYLALYEAGDTTAYIEWSFVRKPIDADEVIRLLNC
jgi:hypothetical protein